jgi:hypothetical protein
MVGFVHALNATNGQITGGSEMKQDFFGGSEGLKAGRREAFP